MLEQTKLHETDSINAEFPGVYFDANEAYGTNTYQEVANNHTMAAGSSSNAGIVHGTPHTDGTEDTAPPLLADNDDDNIKEVDMPENELAEIIDVDADGATNIYQEYPTDEKPGDNLSKNQDGVSNTSDDIAAEDSEDTNKYRADRYNPKGSIKVEDVDNEDDGDYSDDEDDNLIGVYGRYPKCKRKQK